MKQIFQIINQVTQYRGRILAFFIFNLLAGFFALFSLAAIVPFLELIFNQEAVVELSKPELHQTKDSALQLLDYHLKLFIAKKGKLLALYYFSGLVVVMFFLKNIFNYLALYNLAYLRTSVVKDLRNKLFDKLQRLPLQFYGKEKKGDLISRASNDVKEVEWSLLGAIEMTFKHPLYILIYFATLFYTSWQLTLFVLAVLPLSGLLISRLGKRLKNAAKLGQSKLGELMIDFEEMIGGIKIIKGFSAEHQNLKRFTKNNQSHFQLMLKLHRKEFAASPLSEFMGSVVIASILIFGGSLILNQSVGLDGKFFIAYILVFSQLLTPIKAMSEAYFRVQKGIASLDRIDQILSRENQEKLIEFKENSIEKVKQIKFKDIFFKYEKDWVLEGVNIELSAGDMVALVGPSGSGKSTLVDLLPRFYELEKGKIEINGKDIRTRSLASLRSKIGIVTQEPILFHDSVLNNMALGTAEADKEKIIEAAKVANAHEFIMQLPHAYNTMIGDRGSSLSGGQKQRISIARAILKNPEILILDEATSALDNQSEKLVQEALEKVMENRTSIVIAHRLSTIQKADKIYVLDRGKVVQEGNHQELLQVAGLYKSLHELGNLS